jgi:outer membrane usher protein
MSGYDVETQDGVIQVKPKFTDYYNLAYSNAARCRSASPSSWDAPPRST